MKVRYTTEAASLIRKLHPEVKRLVRQALRDLLDNPLIGHELRLNLSGFRSYRVKGYRVLYQIDDRDGFLEIYYVGRRRDVYESFQAFLADKKLD
ncbi:MAG: type II toxin-antitoxin system RelE family toxin [Gammaproteobacteria bacterium]